MAAVVGIKLGKGDEGARARLGIIVPSINIVMEAWAARAVPEGVSVHTARMYMPDGLTPETICEMDRTDGMRAVRQVASCKPAVIAYGCTASSIVQGLAYDAHLRAEIETLSGGPATTAAHAISTRTPVAYALRWSSTSALK